MNRFFKYIKRLMPTSLYARSLIIIISPMILTLLLATVIFFDRHWSTMTRRMSYSVAGEVGALVNFYEQTGPGDQWEKFRAYSSNLFNMTVSVRPDIVITPQTLQPFFWQNPSVILLSQELEKVVRRPFYADRLSEEGWFLVHIPLNDGKTMVIQVSDKRLSMATTKIFLIWMIGAGVIFFIIAAIFMRNQVRPIRRLAIAAEKFGKGQDVERFKPEGATEIRQAAAAFIVMRERIKRQVAQRTEMLSGVSHDLRTIITRMKLQCAMMENNEDTDALKNDIQDMEKMLEGYLAFAKGDIREDMIHISLAGFLEDCVGPLKKQGVKISFDYTEDCTVHIKPIAFKRCVSNLISNAAKYGKEVWVCFVVRPVAAEIVIEDNGPGVPKEKFDEVFKPFYRLDSSRNSNTGGTGLGLSIALDIAHAHGGDIRLAKSSHGGLKAVIRIPL